MKSAESFSGTRSLDIDFHGKGIKRAEHRKITTCERFFFTFSTLEKEDDGLCGPSVWPVDTYGSFAAPLPFRGMIMLAIKAAVKVSRGPATTWRARCVFDVTAACLVCRGSRQRASRL